MNLASFREWIRQIYATQNGELDCEAVFEIVPRYVDLEIAGEDPSQEFPKVKYHLMQCSRCRDLYEGVRDAAAQEVEERVERPVDVEIPVGSSTS